MKKALLFKIFFTIFIFSVFSAHSQEKKSAYAITDSVRDGVKWNFLRTVDLRTGVYSNILIRLLSGNELSSANPGNIFLSNGVAAIAHDKKNKRLYYTPMLIDRLSYIDIKTMTTHVVTTHIVTSHFTGLMPKAADQSNIITRMVIADDEKGYGLTNDGRHLISFSTRNNPVITDLGSLVDAPANNEMSVHNACSSFGGDMIADDEGHLYLFTFGNHVFKITIATRVARYLGTITGLPAGFATSGASVNQNNKVVIVSANDPSGAYVINTRTFAASRLSAGNTWRTADLANPNILQSDDDHHHDHDRELFVNTNASHNDSILLFPNPVTSGEFKIQFDNIVSGKYTVEVIDARGQLAVKKEVSTGGKVNVISIALPGSITKGIYIVRMSDQDNKIVFSDKIVVQ